MYLTREQILEAADLATEEVAVPEWGGVVRVRGLTGAERDRFEESVLRLRGVTMDVTLTNVRARLVSIAVVGEDGKRLFSDADVALLGAKSARALERVFDVVTRLSGLSPGDVKELEKNLSGGRSDDSGSGSPSP